MSESFSLTLQAGAQAFGDASHPSTQGALQLLENMAALRGMRQVLDMGCGSGILALTAAWQWHVPVLAADIEKQAVRATEENARANALDALVRAVRSDGYSHPAIQEAAPFDVILCNMLADPLIRFAADAAAVTAEEGLLLASGILRWRTDEVVQAYAAQGFSPVQKLTIGDWVSLLVQKQ
jgi:ribosomal protein L11 methyltransferase